MIREHADGRAITLANFGPGDIFGELAMFEDERRSAAVETLDEVESIAILGSDMRRLEECKHLQQRKQDRPLRRRGIVGHRKMADIRKYLHLYNAGDVSEIFNLGIAQSLLCLERGNHEGFKEVRGAYKR